MINITATEGKFLTNGVIYASGTLYLPVEMDAAAWSEVDSVIEDKVMSPDETMMLIFGATDGVKKSAVQSAQETLNTIQTLGGLKSDVVQSDKIGYDWRNIYVGDVLVRQDYVEQEHPTGTVDNPITYTEGTPLIENAYYLKDGSLYVWMGDWIAWEGNDEDNTI